MIPRACLAALGQLPGLDIFGNDYPTPDGTAIRDYIHVQDLAAAHVLAVKALLEGAPANAYNLGTGVGSSIGEVLGTFEQLGIHVPHQFKPRRAGDPARLIADSGRAQAELGWAPRQSDLRTIIQSAYRWHQSRL